MSHALGNEVVEFNNEFEKFTTDIQFLVDEVKQEVKKTLDEFRDVQSSQTTRINEIEDIVKKESQHLKDIFKDLGQKFDLFKQKTSNVIENSISSDITSPDNLNHVLEEYAQRLTELEQLQAQFSNLSPEQLREELINGIRMLGDRVSRIIEDINKRIDNFSGEIEQKINSKLELKNFNGQEFVNQDDEDFASLKESKLVDASEYEVVPRKAINKLTALFKKQSAAVKNFIEKHEKKMQEFEKLLKTYDEENTHLLELLDRRVKRNFLISIVAILIVVLALVAVRIF